MVGNKTLQRRYQVYNQKYWNGSLPVCTTVWENLRGKYGATARAAIGHYKPVEYERFDGKRWRFHRLEHRIEIDPKVKHMGIFWQSTLLHEMAHLAVGLKHPRATPHGRLWQKEMLRLATIGAFKNIW